MTSLRDRCMLFFQDENIKKDLRELAKPILEMIYDELNVYVWIVLVYNIFLVFIVLANLFLLIRLLRYSNKVCYID
jgi:hypothetical protein